MPVPTSIVDLSATDSSNSPQDTDVGSSSNGPDDFIRAISGILKRTNISATDVAAASTLTIPNEGTFVKVTGTATVTSFSACYIGRVLLVTFGAGAVLQHSASLLLPTAANVTTLSGDVALFVQRDTSIWQCVTYAKADGTVLGAADATAAAALAAANSAVTTANTAQSTANTALTQSGSASTLATSANTAAGNAVTTANDAYGVANSAYTTANIANNSANSTSSALNIHAASTTVHLSNVHSGFTLTGGIASITVDAKGRVISVTTDTGSIGGP